jgi:hypothetical protein
MRTSVLVLAVLVAFAGVVAFAPAAEAAPPNIGGNGCDYFHWHNGNVQEGQLPGYHWHPCL